MPEELSFIFSLLQSTLLLKIVVVLMFFFYILFALIVFNQVRVMNNIVKIAHFGSFISLIALLHLIGAISLFLIALVIL